MHIQGKTRQMLRFLKRYNKCQKKNKKRVLGHIFIKLLGHDL